MADPAISYVRDGYYEVGDEQALGRHGDIDIVVAAEASFCPLPLTDVRRAMQDAHDARDHTASPWVLSANPDPLNRYSEDLELRDDFYVSFTDRGEVGVAVVVPDYVEPGSEQWRRLEAALEPLSVRHGARVTLHEHEQIAGTEYLGVEVELVSEGRTGQYARDLGREVSALVGAVRGGPLNAAASVDIVRAGLADALVGQRETRWLDGKGEPYWLGDDAANLEFAKDVAAFANTPVGGLIVKADTRRRLPRETKSTRSASCR